MLECQEQLACKWQRRMLGQHLPNCPSNGHPSYQHPSIKCPSNERLSNMNVPDLSFLLTNHHDSLSPFDSFIFHPQLPLYIHVMFSHCHSAWDLVILSVDTWYIVLYTKGYPMTVLTRFGACNKSLMPIFLNLVYVAPFSHFNTPQSTVCQFSMGIHQNLNCIHTIGFQQQNHWSIFTYISISKLDTALLYFNLNTFTIDWMSFP